MCVCVRVCVCVCVCVWDKGCGNYAHKRKTETEILCNRRTQIQTFSLNYIHKHTYVCNQQTNTDHIISIEYDIVRRLPYMTHTKVQ